MTQNTIDKVKEEYSNNPYRLLEKAIKIALFTNKKDELSKAILRLATHGKWDITDCDNLCFEVPSDEEIRKPTLAKLAFIKYKYYKSSSATIKKKNLNFNLDVFNANHTDTEIYALITELIGSI